MLRRLSARALSPPYAKASQLVHVFFFDFVFEKEKICITKQQTANTNHRHALCLNAVEHFDVGKHALELGG